MCSWRDPALLSKRKPNESLRYRGVYMRGGGAFAVPLPKLLGASIQPLHIPFVPQSRRNKRRECFPSTACCCGRKFGGWRAGVLSHCVLSALPPSSGVMGQGEEHESGRENAS